MNYTKANPISSLPMISLFSGAGGLDLGLQFAGFDTRVQIDSSQSCCKTLLLNKPNYWSRSKVLEGQIEAWSTEKLLQTAKLKVGEPALICGGPPCQPFSKSAFWVPHRWKNKKRRRPKTTISRTSDTFEGVKDPRAGLSQDYIRVIREAKPASFIFENVFGLAYKTSRSILEELITGLKDAGYTVTPDIDNIKAGVLNAAEFGVPQLRERLFIIGARNGVKLSLPKPECKKISAGEAIGDLDDGIVYDDEKVAGKWGHLLVQVPLGGNYLFFTEKKGCPNPLFEWRSRYWSFLLKLSPEKPSWTIQGQPGPYTGPFHWSNRRLRVSELKRLQTFPDDYKFFGNRQEIQRQIGNAVPCLLAQEIGLSIKRQIIEAGLIKN